MHILEHLEQEHRKAEAMLDRLRDTEPGDERDELVAELTAALLVHMEVEERFLYPIVANVVGREAEEEADVEHDLVRDGLTKLQRLADEPGFGALVDMVRAGLGHHVEEEEKEIFPKLRDGASSQLDELDPDAVEAEVEAKGVARASGRAAGEPTKQELYEQAKQAHVPGRSSMTKEELAEAVAQARSG